MRQLPFIAVNPPPNRQLRGHSRLHVLHDVFVERFVIRDAALAVHAAKNRVVNAVMQKVHQFAKTTFWNEVGGALNFDSMFLKSTE